MPLGWALLRVRALEMRKDWSCMKRNSWIWRAFLLQKESNVFRSVINLNGCGNILIKALLLLVVFRCLLDLWLQSVRLAAEGKCLEGGDKKQMFSCRSWMRMRWKLKCSAHLGGRCLNALTLKARLVALVRSWFSKGWSLVSANSWEQKFCKPSSCSCCSMNSMKLLRFDIDRHWCIIARMKRLRQGLYAVVTIGSYVSLCHCPSSPVRFE